MTGHVDFQGFLPTTGAVLGRVLGLLKEGVKDPRTGCQMTGLGISRMLLEATAAMAVVSEEYRFLRAQREQNNGRSPGVDTTRGGRQEAPAETHGAGSPPGGPTTQLTPPAPSEPLRASGDTPTGPAPSQILSRAVRETMGNQPVVHMDS